jgi:hypothetical protein
LLFHDVPVLRLAAVQGLAGDQQHGSRLHQQAPARWPTSFLAVSTAVAASRQ